MTPDPTSIRYWALLPLSSLVVSIVAIAQILPEPERLDFYGDATQHTKIGRYLFWIQILGCLAERIIWPIHARSSPRIFPSST